MKIIQIAGICNLHGIIVPSSISVSFNSLSLINSGDFFLKQFNQASFRESWGRVELAQLDPCVFPFFYISGFYRGEKDTPIDEDCLNQISVFLMSLWFIKDCSVNAGYFYTHLPETETNKRRMKDYLFSNHIGLYNQTSFNQEELGLGVEVMNKVIKLTALEADNNDVPIEARYAVTDEHGYTVNHINFLPYRKRNIIFRALDFLALARKSSFLPTKISFYMCVFECLFTIDNTDITRKIKERAAFFIGESPNEKKEIIRVIGKGYDIRSKYFHGQEIKKDGLDNLRNAAKNIDDIIRKVLNKIINLENNFFLNKAEHKEFLINIKSQ